MRFILVALSPDQPNVLIVGCPCKVANHLWDAVAQWLERATDNRMVAGSNPAEAVWKLWQFPLPHFAIVDECMCVYEDLHGKK